MIDRHGKIYEVQCMISPSLIPMCGTFLKAVTVLWKYYLTW